MAEARAHRKAAPFLNYVSFSLYGSNPKYIVGAVRNAIQIRRFYPDFVALFYVDPVVPESCITDLEALGAKFSYMTNSSQISNLMMWRFMAVEKPDADVVLIRDADSRFSERETRAVDQWLRSDNLFHSMRDYPAHDTEIMGGMWGWKKSLRLTMYDDVVNWLRCGPNKTGHGFDQHFLSEVIWPKVAHTVMQHDSFFRDKYPGSIPFPDGDSTADGSFVGEIFDEHDQPQQTCRDARKLGKKSEDVFG